MAAPDGLYWGHGKKSFKHENSGPNSCWNWEVQRMLSRQCHFEVNAYINSSLSAIEEEKMMRCFVRNASATYNVCVRELSAFSNGKIPWDSVTRCAHKEFGLAIRNLVETSKVVGECRPVNYLVFKDFNIPIDDNPTDLFLMRFWIGSCFGIFC